MSFNLQRLLAIVTVCSLTLAAGCGLIRDKSPEGNGIQLGADQSECLAGAGKVWTAWYEGHGDARQITAFWKCASDALEAFLARTRGNQADRYSPQELRSFLTKYFITSFQISDRLLEESMVLKEVMIGGRKDTITDLEIQRILLWFELLKKHTIALIPHMPIEPSRVATRSRSAIDALSAVVSAAAAEIGVEIEKQRKGYTFASMARLLVELNGISDARAITQLGERLRLVTLLKSIFIGADRTQILGTEWQRLLVDGAKDFSVFTKFVHLERNHREWTYGTGRRTMIELTDDLLDILDVAIQRQPRRRIDFAQINELIDLLNNNEIPIPSLSRDRRVLKDVFRTLITKLLGGHAADAQGRLAQGLTRGLIQRTREIVHRWARTQASLESAFGTLARVESGRSGDGLNRMGFTAAQLASTPSGDALAHLITPAPLHRGRDTEVTFDSGSSGRLYWFRGLTKLNWMNELSRAMISGYAGTEHRARNTLMLRQPEFHCFTDEFRKFGIAVKVVDPRTYDMHYKRFLEANLFLPSSDGNDLLSLPETTQLLSYLMSAGAHAQRMHAKVSPRCFRSRERDPFGYTLIDARCFRDNYFSNFRETFRHMPDTVAWYQGLESDKRTEFQRLLEAASRAHGAGDAPIEIGDIQAFSFVMHYVESIFARFDTNRSGHINATEAMNMFPLMRQTLTRLVTELLADDPIARERALEIKNLRGILAWLLAYGSPPDTSSIVGKLKFWAWSNQYLGWNFQADRSRILEILVSLANANSTGSPPPAQTQHSSCWRN